MSVIVRFQGYDSQREQQWGTEGFKVPSLPFISQYLMSLPRAPIQLPSQFENLPV